MRAVIQRVAKASVTVEGAVVSSIGPGLLVLVGIRDGDNRDDLEWCANKVLKARLFPRAGAEEEGAGKPWDSNVMQAGLEVLFVSQFTLYAFFKGNKPDFHKRWRRRMQRLSTRSSSRTRVARCTKGRPTG